MHTKLAAFQPLARCICSIVKPCTTRSSDDRAYRRSCRYVRGLHLPSLTLLECSFLLSLTVVRANKGCFMTFHRPTRSNKATFQGLKRDEDENLSRMTLLRTIPFSSGTYSEAGSIQCFPCYDGFYSEEGWSSCLPCDAGYYRLSTSSNGACDPCTAGTYAPLDQASECLSCPRGFYSDVRRFLRYYGVGDWMKNLANCILYLNHYV